MNDPRTIRLLSALREQLLSSVDANLMTTPDEAGFWAWVTTLEWPIPSPEFEGLHEKIADGISLLRAGRTFAEVVAIRDGMLALCRRFEAARRSWPQPRLLIPPGLSSFLLASYAVVRGKQAFEQAIFSPEEASKLAAEPGFKAHHDALLRLEDLFQDALRAASEDDLVQLIEAAAETSCSGAPSRGILHHPRLGFGVILKDSGEELLVHWAEEERSLRGAERSWRSWDARFRTEAWLVVRRAPLAPDVFWSLVEKIGWSEEKPTGTTEALHTAEIIAAFASTRIEMLRTMEQRLQTWELQTARTIEAGDDSFNDLCNHLIGLGRATYEAALAEPALAAERAESHRFRESFAYVEQEAWAGLPMAEIEGALRATPGASYRDDPVRGLGLETHRGEIVWSKRLPFKTLA